MAIGISLQRWTDQGLRNIKDTIARARTAIAAVEKAGGKLTTYYTQGQYDLISILEGSLDDETSSAIALGIVQAGNIRTETLRAFTIDEMERIIRKIP
jgi:uncharacterized protein with GYD domain